jgi:chitinase
MPGGGIKPPPKPADCTPAEASLCFTTRKFATTVSGDQTRTTATSTTERCATITGCNFKDADTTKDSDVCTIDLDRRGAATASPEITDAPRLAAAAPTNEKPTRNHRSALLRRDDEPLWCNERSGLDNILLMKRPQDEAERAQIIEILKKREKALDDRHMNGKYYEVRSETLGFTAFFYVYNLGDLGRDYFRRDKKVSNYATVS